MSTILYGSTSVLLRLYYYLRNLHSGVLYKSQQQALKLPKNLDVTTEILEHLHQVKVNLPLLHMIKQMPLYAKVIKDLCTAKRKYHVKKTAFLTE